MGAGREALRNWEEEAWMARPDERRGAAARPQGGSVGAPPCARGKAAANPIVGVWGEDFGREREGVTGRKEIEPLPHNRWHCG